MRYASCPECNRLWDEYASATMEHAEIAGALSLATVRRDTGDLERLTRAAESAAQNREAVLYKIIGHKREPHKALGSLTLLLVDDDDQVRRIYREVLAANGFRVLEADNGMEAILIAAEQQGAIDLLITDLEMPRIGGAKLASAFRKIWPRVNVLYISGSPEDVSAAQLSSDCAFLPKPFGPEALVDAVDELLEAA